MTNADRLVELLSGRAGRFVGGVVASWCIDRRRAGLAVPAEVVELVRLLEGSAREVQSSSVAGSESAGWVSSEMTAQRLGVSGSAVARRARLLEGSGRARRAADRWSWEIEETAVDEWEQERERRGAA